MDDQPIAVESQVQAAAPVQEAPITPEASTETLPTVEQWRTLVEEKKRIEQEKDNYRSGLLKAKARLKANGNESVEETNDLESLIDRKVEEKLLAAQELIVEKKHNEFVQSILLKNDELKRALQNKEQMPNASMGSSQGKPSSEVQDLFFSPDQLVDLKRRGLDPAKVKENWLKQKR